MAVPLSGGCCLVALCQSSRAEGVCFSKRNTAVRSWAGLQPGFISFTPRLAGPHGRMTKEGAAVRAPCRYTSTVAKMRISPRKEQSRGRSCPAACTSHASSVGRVFLVLFTRMAMMRAANAEKTKRSDRTKGFVVLPRRWVVERTFAWLNRCRRLAKDWENLNRNALAFLRLASIRLMLRKLCNPA